MVLQHCPSRAWQEAAKRLAPTCPPEPQQHSPHAARDVTRPDVVLAVIEDGLLHSRPGSGPPHCGRLCMAGLPVCQGCCAVWEPSMLRLVCRSWGCCVLSIWLLLQQCFCCIVPACNMSCVSSLEGFCENGQVIVLFSWLFVHMICNPSPLQRVPKEAAFRAEAWWTDKGSAEFVDYNSCIERTGSGSDGRPVSNAANYTEP